MPAADMVAVFTADIADEDPHPTDGFVLRYLVPACTDLPGGVIGRTYRDHGFRLRLPPGWTAGEAPFPGREDQWNTAGVVQALFHGYPIEVVSVAWVPAEGPEAMEAALEEALAASGPGVEPGAQSRSEWDGHEILIQEVALAESGVALAGRTAAWYCPEAGRVYIFSWVTDAELVDTGLPAGFEAMLDGFACH